MHQKRKASSAVIAEPGAHPACQAGEAGAAEPAVEAAGADDARSAAMEEAMELLKQVR